MANFIVTTAADIVNAGDGVLSLREAVASSNGAAGADTITFDAAVAGSTITLTSGELILTDVVTIDGDSNGDNKADITISGNDASRIFNTSVNTDLLSLDITDGHSGSSNGGAIHSSGGTLVLVDTTVRDSVSNFGKSGGGVFSSAALTVTNSTISGNYGYFGGGLSVSGIATITNTTIDGNSSYYGGGIHNTGTTEVINSTITNNSSILNGGGAFNGSSLGLQNTVVALNSASTGRSIYSHSATLTAQNSFFGTNVAISTDNGGNLNNAGDPLLGALADNGGTVETRFELTGSQLIDAGSNALVPGGVVTDANGDARIQSGTVDIGAVESPNNAPTFDATLTGLTAAFTFNGDAGFDYFGHSVSGAGDINGDGFDDVIVGAIGDDNNGTDSGSARVLSGVDGSVLFTFDGDAEIDYFGVSVSGAGDINGDGFDDVIVGASGDDNNGTYSGSARVLSGADGSVMFTFDGDAQFDYFGNSVSGAGDINGDGFDDLIVGAPGNDNNGSDSGSARVLSGADGSVLFTFDGDAAGDRFGRSVSGAGDINRDGFDDLIVGAPGDDNNGSDSGSARVLSGADGSVLFTFDGDAEIDQFGGSVSGAGDINGDGFDDLIVGASGDDNNGSNSGSARVLSGADGSVLFTFDGDAAIDRFGGSVSGAGDVNGDGFNDVIVGAVGDDNNGDYSGSARVLSGADGSVLFTFDGDAEIDYFGFSVSGTGDVNGDGFDDVIIGALRDSNNGGYSGSARLFTSTGTGRLDNVRAFTEGDAVVVLDNDVAVADTELDALSGGNGDYHGGSLNIQRQGGGNADDLFDFTAMANVTVNGSNLEVGGFTIATFTAVGGVLNINFTNANGATPTTVLVNEIIQAVTYENPITTLALGEQELVPLEWVFSDGEDNLTDIINIDHSGIGGRMLTGTPADDILNATLGDDTVDGLAANDTLDFGVSTAGVTVNLNLTGPQATGGSGTDTISNIEHLSGGSGNDRFIGKAGTTVGDNILSGAGGADQFFGLGGNDTLNGGNGNDFALGGAGNDQLNGNDGDDILKSGNDNDTLTGGIGRDLLFGQAGADTFTFNDITETGLVYLDRDIIRDFNQGEGDKIDLSGIDAITGGSDNAFTFLGTGPASAFTQSAGELLAVNTAGGQTVVWGDVDGDGTQDFTFVLDGALALTDSDFIL